MGTLGALALALALASPAALAPPTTPAPVPIAAFPITSRRRCGRAPGRSTRWTGRP